MRMRFRHSVLPLFVFAVLVAGGCNGDDPLVGPGSRTKYNLQLQSPATVTGDQDEVVDFDPKIMDADNGTAVSNAAIDAEVADTSIAKVTDDGLQLRRGGTTTIALSWMDANRDSLLTATVNVSVNPVEITAHSLTPNTATIYAGDSKSFVYLLQNGADTLKARPYAIQLIDTDENRTDDNGDPLVFGSVSRTVTDTIKKVPVVKFTSVRRDTIVVPRTDTIIVSAWADAAGDRVVDTAFVTIVTRPVESVEFDATLIAMTQGDTLRLKPTLVGAGGKTVTGRTITWASDNPAIATVDPASGLVTAVDEAVGGTAHITATSEGKVGTVTIVVPAAVP